MITASVMKELKIPFLSFNNVLSQETPAVQFKMKYLKNEVEIETNLTGFFRRPLICKFQQEVFKFSDICLIWSSPKTDLTEAVTRRCSIKKLFYVFRTIHRKHLCQSLFDKVAWLRPVTLLKKRLWHRCFPVNFAEFLRLSVFIEHRWWLLLT